MNTHVREHRQKKKFVEDLSDEELLKVVEDVELNMVKKMSDEELLKAVKHIESPLFKFKFRPWGRENVGRKMWWRNNGLQHA